MKKVIKNKLSNILLISFIFLIIISWFFSGWPQIWQRPQIPPKVQEAQAAIPTFVACGTYDGGTGNVTPTLPTGWQQNDIFLLFVENANQPGAAPSGYTKVADSPQGTGTAGGTTATSLEVFWKRAGASESNPTVADRGDHTLAVICAFRGILRTGDPWDVTSGGVEAISDTTLSATGDTTTVTDTFVVIATANNIDANTTTRYSAWANINLTGVTEIVDRGINSGNGGGLGVATGQKASAGVYGNTTATLSAAGTKGFMTIALKPQPITTLGDGTDPSNSTVAPGSTTNYLDQFTFLTDYNTDSVTALTITTANTTAIAGMQIWNNAMTVQYFGTVSTPAGNSWNFSGGTPIPVTTSQTAFRVIFTAKNHASLAQGSYPVTGTVTSFTCSNIKAGTDTDSATITIDNFPPADATWGTITTGDSQIILNWTNPGDADFNKVVILRKNNSAITDAPTDGAEYNVNDTVGSSTVRYVGNGTTFIDTGLANGTNYYYKIFAYDAYINYAVGLGTGPHVPLANVITVGSSGSQTSSMNIPSINNYVGGAFTFIRSVGTANITQIIITETGTVNAYTSLSNVKLYYDTINCVYDGTEPQYGLAGSFNSSAKATFNGNVPVSTSQVCFYVVLDVGLGALDNQTLEVEISNPSTEVTVSAGNVSPATPVVIVGTTTLEAVVASWRENLDTPATNVSKNDNIRLRIELANIGGSGPADFRLEYAPKNVTCGSFIAVPTVSQFTNQHFVMSDSIYVTNSQNTTAKFPNVESYTFDSGKIIAEPSNSSGSINLSQNHYTEIEFVFKPTNNAVSGEDYCFRITNNGVSLDSYAVSPELQIIP